MEDALRTFGGKAKKNIVPHIPVIDKSERGDGTLS
jgi:hypothetical protein